MADRGDNETISEHETLVEKSERMEREHSARREVKRREERVRRISEQSERSRPRPEGVNGARRLPPVRPKEGAPDSTKVSPPPLASRAHRTDEARSFADEDSRSESRSPKTLSKSQKRPVSGTFANPNASTTDTGERKVRISDPFPPIGKKRPAAEGNATKPPVTSTGTRAPAGSSLDLLAIEIEALLMAMRMGWKHMGFGDRVTLIAAVFVVGGVLMPWLSTPAGPLQIGLNVGGLVHLGIALTAVALVVGGQQKTTTRVLALSPRERDESHRRASLYIVLLGFCSTVFSVYLFVVYGMAKSSTWPVTFHAGLYWTLAMTTGLSYGGYARFRG